MEFHFGNAWTTGQGPREAPALVYEGKRAAGLNSGIPCWPWRAPWPPQGLTLSQLGLYLLNYNEYTEAHFGAFKLGACPINVNYRYQADEARLLLENSDAEAVLFHSRFADRIEEIRPRPAGVKLYLQVDDGSEAPLLAGAVAFEAASPRAAPGTWAPRPADDIYMLYTGGTTGMPRA